MKKIHIIGGGTFSFVRNHLALSAPAFGETARTLHKLLLKAVTDSDLNALDVVLDPTLPVEGFTNWLARSNEVRQIVNLHLTKMANHNSKLVTNEDVAALLEQLKADPDTRVIILNAALCDYDGRVDTIGLDGYIDRKVSKSGPHAQRLKTAAGETKMVLTPAAKLIGSIRKERKDIFVVGFKTTTGASSDEQYRIALDMLKRDSLNLVLANDTVTRNNMIVAPEETRYGETTDRKAVLEMLAKMVLSRSSNTFTRSTVVDGPSVAWDAPEVPENLRAVVDHCIARGAYKPFRGVTAGHFAVKVDEGRILTSKRKRNFNQLSEEGLVLVEYEGDDKVIAHGAKPSVGGQSQRVIFREHPEMDCIVHFHCPLKEDHASPIAVADQWQNECGSHQCGKNTSDHLIVYPGTDMKAVMLDGHGPNIVFSRTTPPEDVIAFIESNWDLSQKTGGLVA
jgi:hypothetical protein